MRRRETAARSVRRARQHTSRGGYTLPNVCAAAAFSNEPRLILWGARQEGNDGSAEAAPAGR